MQTQPNPSSASTPPEMDLWQLVTSPEMWGPRIVDFLPMLGRALLVLVVFWILFRVLRPVLARVLQRATMDPALVQLLVDGLLKWSLRLVALVMAIGQLGVDVTAAIAGLGVAGIAIGLAAQDSVANVIAGITIFLDRPFRVGEWITTGDQHGQVAEIKLRTTRIRTRQNTYLVVPNKHIIDSTIINHSLYGDVRVDIPIGIAYKEFIPRAREVIVEATRKVDFIDHERTEVVALALGSSSVDLSLRVWIDDATDDQRAHFRCLEAAKLALDAAGIQIPYPHLQLFVEKVEEPAVESLQRALAG